MGHPVVALLIFVFWMSSFLLYIYYSVSFLIDDLFLVLSSGQWLTSPDLSQCQSYWLQKLRRQLDKQASIVHVANDLAHYTSSFGPLSPGDLLLLIDTIEVMTLRMKDDLNTIPTLDQRRAVITEVVQVSFVMNAPDLREIN